MIRFLTTLVQLFLLSPIIAMTYLYLKDRKQNAD